MDIGNGFVMFKFNEWRSVFYSFHEPRAVSQWTLAMAAVVGFSYGRFVAFELAAAHTELVRSIVVSGSTVKYTRAMKDNLLGRLGGAQSLTELLLPESVGQLRLLFSNAVHMKLWFLGHLLKDFLKVSMYNTYFCSPLASLL